MPYALVAAPDLLLAGLANGQIWASRDRGDSWHRSILHGDPLVGLHALAAAPV